MNGKVYLVGAGPGAPDLLTLRAAKLLEVADIVIHDALVHPETLALANKARLVDVGKRSRSRSTDQRFICRFMVSAAKRYQTVVRLKGGDPMIFGRTQEELDALHEAGIQVEVVPGITAALAASAQLKAPLTRRGDSRSVVFLTPRVGAGQHHSAWALASRAADTLAIYMAAGDAMNTLQQLTAAGWSTETPIALVESASLPGSQTWRGALGQLPDLGQHTGDGPVMVIVGAALGPVADQESAVDQSTLSRSKRI
jgi:uroporphyrin-III C-methyltransferase